MANRWRRTRGEPDLEIGPLRIWICGREHPSSSDDWLFAEAKCATENSRVTLNGSFLHSFDLASWLEELRRLHASVEGTAELTTMEEMVRGRVDLGALGGGTLTLRLEVHTRERHEWTVPIESSYLPAWIRALERVLARFPSREIP